MYEYVDECEGTTDMINDFWTYYEDDFKVDRDGNPHFLFSFLVVVQSFVIMSQILDGIILQSIETI